MTTPDTTDLQLLFERLRRRAFFSSPPTVMPQESGVVAMQTRVSGRTLLQGVLIAGFLLSIPWVLSFLRGVGQPQGQLASFKELLATIAGPVMGTLILGGGVMLLLRREQIVLDRRNGAALFRWGIRPWIKEAKLPLASLRAHLQLCDQPRGYTLLCLVLAGSDEEEEQWIPLAVTKWRSELSPIFELLRQQLNGRGEDATQIAAVELGGQLITHAPIRLQAKRGCSHRLTLANGRAVLRSNWKDAFICLLIAFVVPATTVALDAAFGLIPKWLYVLVLSISALFCALAWYMRPRLVMVMRDDWLRLPGCAVDGSLPDRLHGSAIRAVQLCVNHEEGEQTGQYRRADFMAYQINLICHTGQPLRVNLCTDHDIARATATADQLAAFLEVPLLYHRAPAN